MAALVGDLVDPDPAQTREPVSLGLGIGNDPGHDRPDRAPGDPQQITHRGLRTMRHQPRGGVIKGVGVAGAVPRPRNLRSNDPMLGAPDPRRVSLQERLDRAQVQRPLAPPPLALAIARAVHATPAAPALGGLARPDRHHDRLLDLVELNAFLNSLDQTQQLSP